MALLLLALEEPLFAGHTLGIWGEALVGANYLQGESMAGFSPGGELGLGWWVHHNFGLRARVGLENLSLKSESVEYYWQAWRATGEAAVRLLSEDRRLLPYFGGFGGYAWEFSGVRVEDGTGRDLDSLRQFPVYGGFVGLMVRMKMYQMLICELGGGAWSGDMIGYLRAGYTFKLLW